MSRRTHSTRAPVAPWALAALLLSTVPAAGRGQSLDALAPDARIRVDLLATTRSWRGREQAQSVVGTLAGVHADTVLLTVHPGAAPVRVPLASTRAVFVTRGRPPRWQAAMRGAMVPALMGAAASAVSISIRRRETDPRPAQMVLSSAAWGAASGAVLGGWSPKERWRRLTVPAAVAPAVPAGVPSTSPAGGARTP